jgi:hypothetical protein
LPRGGILMSWDQRKEQKRSLWKKPSSTVRTCVVLWLHSLFPLCIVCWKIVVARHLEGFSLWVSGSKRVMVCNEMNSEISFSFLNGMGQKTKFIKKYFPNILVWNIVAI